MLDWSHFYEAGHRIWGNIFNLVIDATPEDISEVNSNTLNFLVRELKNEAGNVNEISFIDRYGNEIVKKSDVQGLDIVVLNNVVNRDDFKIAISGKNYFSEINYTLAGPVMRIASQIENKNRDIIGVISAEIDLNPLTAILSGVRLGNQGFVYLIDAVENLVKKETRFNEWVIQFSAVFIMIATFMNILFMH